MPPVSPHPIDQISAALSAASLRHQVIAANIANRDTQGYQRMKVAFDAALGATDAQAQVIPEAAVRPPSIEQDMVALSANQLDYQALARTLSRYFSIAQTIANGGRS